MLTKFLKEIKGVIRIKKLSKSEKEDMDMVRAIHEGETGEYVDSARFLKESGLRGF